ncbi:MAG: hypothetical protein AAF405_03765 [Pseudomonadota bacterium]
MAARAPTPERIEACMRAGKAYREHAVAASAAAYVRAQHLPQLLPLTQDELADHSCKGRRNVIARLLRAARKSARLGHAGHWSYDPNYHTALLGALRAERAGLAGVTQKISAVAPPLRGKRTFST